MAENINTILDQTIAALEEETTVIDALDVFVDGVLKELKALQVDPAKIAKIQELMTKNRQKLADAFTENLVVPPVEPPVEPPAV